MTFMVVFGLHWGFTPITLQNIANGGDPIEAMASAAVFAQIGVAFGIFLRAKKDRNLRSIAASSGITGLLAGVSEPIVYGLILRYKRVIPIVIIAGALGGAINGHFGVLYTAYVFHNIFSIPVEQPMSIFIVSMVVSMGTGLLLTWLFGYEGKGRIEASARQPRLNPFSRTSRQRRRWT